MDGLLLESLYELIPPLATETVASSCNTSSYLSYTWKATLSAAVPNQIQS